jgi:hypothetical protein
VSDKLTANFTFPGGGEICPLFRALCAVEAQLRRCRGNACRYLYVCISPDSLLKVDMFEQGLEHSIEIPLCTHQRIYLSLHVHLAVGAFVLIFISVQRRKRRCRGSRVHGL